MTAWPEIGCQRGHDSHATRRVQVRLGGPTGYTDLPPIPDRFRREFPMLIWDWPEYMTDGPYCPARDAVSETIGTLGVWEPRETILTLQVCSSGDGIMVDVGAQVGWFSLLAASCGMGVLAFDADPECCALLESSARLAGLPGKIRVEHFRIGPGQVPAHVDVRIRLLKIDVEGAEPEAVDKFWQPISEGLVDHLLVEISPVFHGRYPNLVERLIGAGYRAYLLPEKRRPPVPLDVLPDDLRSWRLDRLPAADLRSMVAGWHQENVWFAREGAAW